MNLRIFYSRLTIPERDAFAARCESTRGVLQNIMYGVRPCNPELAVLIERESAGQVTRRELRPSDWHRIWPELAANEPWDGVTERRAANQTGA